MKERGELVKTFEIALERLLIQESIRYRDLFRDMDPDMFHRVMETMMQAGVVQGHRDGAELVFSLLPRFKKELLAERKALTSLPQQLILDL